MKKIIIPLLIMILILEIIIITNQNKKIDTGLHKIQECVMINEEVYCKIAMPVNESKGE